MRFAVWTRYLLPLVSLATLNSCSDDDSSGPTAPNDSPVPNFVQLQSDAGDPLGRGMSFSYTNENAIIAVGARDARLTVTISGDDGWSGEFRLPPPLSRIEAGSYPGMNGGFPLEDRSQGSLFWSRNNTGCNTIAGSLTVDSATYDGGQLATVDLRFEQRCGNATGSLRGTIHWRADDTTAAAGPVIPIPADVWQPPAGTVPATGDYLYLVSDAGDYIGMGQTYLYQPASSSVTVTSTVLPTGAAKLTLTYAIGWRGIFQAMPGVPRLKVGYYGDLGRNLVKGAFEWAGNNRACSSVAGWFAVDRVSYVGDQLTAIELRFEQHCDQKSPAIRGALRWTRPM